jgi:hypothetical protein
MPTKLLQHELFTEKAKDTQDDRRRILEKFCDCVTPSGRRFGDNFFRGITTANIQAAIKGGPPTVHKDLLKALRLFCKLGINQGEIQVSRHLTLTEAQKYVDALNQKRDVG